MREEDQPIQIVDQYPNRNEVPNAVSKGYLPWRCIHCNELMVEQVDDYLSCCMNCGTLYNYPQDDLNSNDLEQY